MGFFDLLFLIVDNLSRRKARVALTAVGVVIGTAAVVILVSLAIGLQRNANEQLWGIGDLTQIQVWPTYGDMGPMMGGPGPQTWPPPNSVLITDDAIEQFKAIPNVVAVIPRDNFMGNGTVYYQKLETWPGMTGLGGITDLAELGLEAEQGTLVMERGAVIVGTQVANQFYNPRPRPGEEPPSPPDLMDANLKLTMIKYTTDGQEVRKSIPIRVIGVIAPSQTEADWSWYMPIEDITAYNEWMTGKRINRNKDGYQFVTVKVNDPESVIDVTDQLTEMGFQATSPTTYVQGINSFYMVLQVIFGGVGAIALLVAAIGIANTMTMAILERTREIGLMKAIGATNRDVLSVFLGEAAGIGFFGGLGGVIAGWSLGQIINVLAMAYLAAQSAETGSPPPSIAVYTPTWLPVFSLIFATIIGLLSGLYPALRAATLVPVNALKYE
jgi:putative ABC transport system permease protein